MNRWGVAALICAVLVGWMLGVALQASGVIVTCTGCK